MGKRIHRVPRVAENRIICSFFKHLDQKYTRFTCESLHDDFVDSTGLSFNDSDELNRFLAKYCANDPTKCRYYQALLAQKYPNTEAFNFEQIKAEQYRRE